MGVDWTNPSNYRSAWKSLEHTQRILAVLGGKLKQGAAQWYVIQKQYVTNVDNLLSKVEREFIPAYLQERLRKNEQIERARLQRSP